VRIHALRVLEDHGGGRVTIEARCGSGTYMRSLAADIGERLGCGAYCEALRRTAVGDLSVADAVAPEEVGETGGIDPLRGLAHLPVRRLGPDEADRLRHGVPVPPGDAAGEGPVALVADGRLLGVGVPRDGALRPAVILDAR
jgi:tRNA pseudouridine55 synthase